jgi:hypothetical protein
LQGAKKRTQLPDDPTTKAVTGDKWQAKLQISGFLDRKSKI